MKISCSCHVREYQTDFFDRKDDISSSWLKVREMSFGVTHCLTVLVCFEGNKSNDFTTFASFNSNTPLSREELGFGNNTTLWKPSIFIIKLYAVQSQRMKNRTQKESCTQLFVIFIRSNGSAEWTEILLRMCSARTILTDGLARSTRSCREMRVGFPVFKI